jgi:peptide/nickel transport system permease protein
MGLLRYVTRRTIYTIILLFLVIGFNFVLFQILPFAVSCPGKSYNQCAESLYVPPYGAPKNPNAAKLLAQERAEILKLYGFDTPIWNRFLLYIKAMLTFNFGFNIGGALGGTVLSTIQQRTPYTVVLIGTSTVAAYIIGIALGIVAAAKRGKVLDVSSLGTLLFLNALPTFFLGAMLELAQKQSLGTFYVPIGTSILLQSGIYYYVAYLKSLFLPFMTLTLAGIGGVFLTERAVMIDTVAEDYVLMARAKGLPERTVLYKHAFRNAVLPITTAFVIGIGFILGGAIVTETVFGWPGLGQATYLAISAYDFPLEQAIFFIITVMVLICVFAADILYGFLDPRVSTG